MYISSCSQYTWYSWVKYRALKYLTEMTNFKKTEQISNIDIN